MNVENMRVYARVYRACLCDSSQRYHDYVLTNTHMPRRLLEIRVNMLIDNRVVPAFALIDIGATHTFMARRFIKRHGIRTQELPDTMRVRVADGSAIRTSERTHALVMRIGDAYAERTSFISLDLERYDVLLGLDWLEKHDAVLYAKARKMIFYTTSSRTRVEHILYVERDAAPTPPRMQNVEPEVAQEAPSDEEQEPKGELKHLSFKSILRFARRKGVEMFRVTVLREDESEERETVEGGIHTTAHAHPQERSARTHGSQASVPHVVEQDDSLRSSTARVLNMPFHEGPLAASRPVGRRKRVTIKGDGTRRTHSPPAARSRGQCTCTFDDDSPSAHTCTC